MLIGLRNAKTAQGEASAGRFADIQASLHSTIAGATEDHQRAIAETLTAVALRSYWHSLLGLHRAALEFPQPRSGQSPVKLDEAARGLAGRLGELLAPLSSLEAAYRVGLIYTGLLPNTYRARRGVYYTPPALAGRLLDQAEAAGLDWTRARVLDPACGGSAFLLPAVLRMLETLATADPAITQQNLRTRLAGWEIDPFAAWLSRIFVEIACLPVSARTGRLLEPAIVVKDSLRAPLPRERFDLVVGNPPFGRTRLDPAIRERYSRGLYGHANLYGMFTELAVRLVEPGGLVSFLTPASFLAGEYFKNLRGLLWDDAPPVRVELVASRKDVFEGVLQETVLATYRREVTRWPAGVALLHPKSDGSARVERAGTFALPKVRTAPWILPRSSRDKVLTRRMRGMPTRLADWGYQVSTGPLVWNRFKDQLRKQDGPGCVPLIWAECVTADGRFILRSVRRGHVPFLYLRPGKDDWLRIERPCVLLQRTTAKEQHRRLIAAAMPADFIHKYRCVTVENHLNMLLPTMDKPAVSPEALAVFLNSRAADQAFRCVSGSVAVSAYELESLPLPSLADMRAIEWQQVRQASPEAIERRIHRAYFGQTA